MKNLILHFILFLMILSLLITTLYFFGKKIWYPYYEKCFITKDMKPTKPPLESNQTEDNNSLPLPKVLTSKERLKYHLADADFIIYPKKLTLIGLKYEKILEVWGRHNGEEVYITTYPFTSFSGRLGPKFREGDRQIPEGIYGIGYLNPNSKFHLSLNINYPNNFDKKMAKRERRTNLGSAIMIHGGNRSIGCISIGDDKIEELYYLVEKVGIKNTKVIIAPIDFRVRNVKVGKSKHPWVIGLYDSIKKEMQQFKISYSK